ncbi:DNA primase small subunit [Halotydeus destructor]|nr:DNA primase small subunit [Halotydeus destructor]
MLTKDSYDPDNLGDLLYTYYKQLFPHQLFYDWLSYSNVDPEYFDHREFSFTLPGDIYIRYQSFSSADEFKKALIEKRPEKIDIGAVFSLKPKDAKKAGVVLFQAKQRELVFDIDMTDYDEVRTCCKGADICENCWPFMTIAGKVLNRALSEDFGFKHFLWVYSGRRGIHCWIGDKSSRELSVEARAALASYLTLIEGGQYKTKKVEILTKNLHPSIGAAVSIIDKYFDDLIVGKQKLMDTIEQRKAVINLCSNQELKNLLLKNVLTKKFKTSLCFWDEVQSTTKGFFDASQKSYHGKHYISEVKLQYCYPRLDINVSKGLNHLLKAPFCIHPKTGRVCIPIDITKIDTFKPSSVPTVSKIVNQLCEFEESHKALGDSEGIKDHQKTDLKPSISLFKTFIDAMKVVGMKEKRENDANKLEF